MDDVRRPWGREDIRFPQCLHQLGALIHPLETFLRMVLAYTPSRIHPLKQAYLEVFQRWLRVGEVDDDVENFPRTEMHISRDIPCHSGSHVPEVTQSLAYVEVKP